MAPSKAPAPDRSRGPLPIMRAKLERRVIRLTQAGFIFSVRLSIVGDCEARADSQGGELVDRIAAAVPVRKALFVRARRARSPRRYRERDKELAGSVAGRAHERPQKRGSHSA